MKLYIITDCDAPAADRTGRQMSRIKLDGVFYSSSRRGKATAESILKYQNADNCRFELLESICSLDGEKAEAFMGAPAESLLSMGTVALVVPAEDFGQHLGPKIMHVSDRALSEGVQFAAAEGTISMFELKKGEQVDSSNSFVNASLHLKVSDIEAIKDLRFSCE